VKKLLAKNKHRSHEAKNQELQLKIFKSVHSNSNLFILTRWGASFKLQKNISIQNSFFSLSPRCLKTISKKRYNRITFYSRFVFLKVVRNGLISGIRKAIW
jgi:ribosomal protein S14